MAIAAAVVLVAVAVRGVAVWRLADGLAHDTDGYRAVARSLVEQGDLLRDGQPTAWRPPLYPLLLAKLLWLSDWAAAPRSDQLFVAFVGLTQVALGAATALLVLRLGWRLGLGRWSLLAAALVICDPLLVYQSAQLMTETLATFLAVCAWSLLVAEKRSALRAIASGVVFGLATLCRPTFLLWAVLLLIWFAWRALRQRTWRNPALATIAFLLTIAPWGARNWIELGRPIVTTTHGGYTLLLANNPGFYR
ncbi:MAG: ArnT family glycosyltransferase, partial [Pirellulales bacterium]